VDHEDELKLARDLIIRSYWNERNWKMVIESSKRFPEHPSAALAIDANKKLIIKPKIKKELAPVSGTSDNRVDRNLNPAGVLNDNWDEKNVLNNWHQLGKRLWFRSEKRWSHWDMPEGFSLKSTSDSLIELATEVLISPWHNDSKEIKTARRISGKEVALSFSGGMDSSAAMLIMPESTILGYHKRDFESMIKHENAEILFSAMEEKLSRKVISIGSDHELIRSDEGKMVGFSTDYASGVHLILLADFLDLKGIAFGLPIDNGWLNKGKKFRNFEQSNHWQYWSKRFNHAGLDLILPINMISEAGALKICAQSKIIDSINSCLRGSDQKGCGKCWKCFHKNGPLGRDIDTSSYEISTFLAQRPLRTAMHALWAIQKMSLGHLVPDLEHYFENGLSWWEQIYMPGFDLIPHYLRAEIKVNSLKVLEPMVDNSKLENLDLFGEN